MSAQTIDVEAHIDNTPEAVIRYIADVRNRPLYLPSLKSVSDIRGEPSAAGTTWRWTWAALGMEFEGRGQCLQHEPGKLYAFRTEGGIASNWTYRAEADGQGTKLTVHIDYEVPERARPRLPTDKFAESMRKTEAEHAIHNLKHILDQ